MQKNGYEDDFEYDWVIKKNNRIMENAKLLQEEEEKKEEQYKVPKSG